MEQDTMFLLPQMGKLNQWLKSAEKELQKEFGKNLKLVVSGMGSVFSIDAVVKMVSDKLSVPINRLLGTDRVTHEREARQIAMYLCHKFIPDVTLVEIGEFFSKDHTTVMNALTRVRDLLKSEDPSVTDKVSICENEFFKRLKLAHEIPPIIHEAQ